MANDLFDRFDGGAGPLNGHVANSGDTVSDGAGTSYLDGAGNSYLSAIFIEGNLPVYSWPTPGTDYGAGFVLGSACSTTGIYTGVAIRVSGTAGNQTYYGFQCFGPPQQGPQGIYVFSWVGGSYAFQDGPINLAWAPGDFFMLTAEGTDPSVTLKVWQNNVLVHTSVDATENRIRVQGSVGIRDTDYTTANKDHIRLLWAGAITGPMATIAPSAPMVACGDSQPFVAATQLGGDEAINWTALYGEITGSSGPNVTYVAPPGGTTDTITWTSADFRQHTASASIILSGGVNPLNVPASPVYYASQCGVVFDGSDQSTAVQAIANNGQSGPILIVLDGAKITLKGILLYSGTMICGLGFGTVVTQGVATSVYDGCIFRNAHFASPYQGGVISDSNITIRDMYLDGNSRNGSSGTSDRRLAPDGSFVQPIKLFGVNGFCWENLYIYDPCSMGILTANTFNGWIRNVTGIDPFTVETQTAGTGRNTSVIQFLGPHSDIDIDGLYGATDDDFVAFNGCDGSMRNQSPLFAASWGGAGGYAVAWYGSIQRVTARNLFPSLCANIVRVLSGTPVGLPQATINQIIVTGVVGNSQNQHFIASSFTDSYGTTGAASYGDIIFRDWVVGNIPRSGQSYFGSQLGGTWRSFTLAGWKLGSSSACGAAIQLQADASVSQLKLVDWTVNGAGQPLVQVSQGAVTNIVLDGVSAENVPNIIDITGGTVGGINSVGLIHSGAGAGNGSINIGAGVTVGRLHASGSTTALLVSGSGTITDKKTDGTEDA